MNRIFELLISLFDTKAKRYLFLVFLCMAMVSIIIDNLVIGPQTFLEQLTMTAGCGGGALFFGLLLISAKQIYGFKRWQLTILALIYMIGGLLFIGLFYR